MNKCGTEINSRKGLGFVSCQGLTPMHCVFVKLNTPFAYYGWGPTITAKGGILYVTWSGYFSYSEDGGQTFAEKVKFAESALSGSTLAIDSNFNIYITWVDWGSGLYFASSKDKGGTFVTKKIATDAQTSSLAVDAIGNVFLAWFATTWHGPAFGSDIYFAFSEAGSDRFSPPVRISQGNPNWGMWPSITFNNAQDALIAWESEDGVYFSKSVHCTD